MNQGSFFAQRHTSTHKSSTLLDKILTLTRILCRHWPLALSSCGIQTCSFVRKWFPRSLKRLPAATESISPGILISKVRRETTSAITKPFLGADRNTWSGMASNASSDWLHSSSLDSSMWNYLCFFAGIANAAFLLGCRIVFTSGIPDPAAAGAKR